MFNVAYSALRGIVCKTLLLPAGNPTKKLLLIMKFTVIILLSASLMASAKGTAQPVTLTFKNAPLEQVFAAIKKQTGYAVFYNYRLLERAKPVTIAVKNTPVEEVLKICLKDQPLDFEISGKSIVITAKLQAEVSIPTPPLIDIKGRIVNESGEPVVASVMVKGTGNGTTSNTDGYFELKNVENNARLLVSGVNIETTEIAIAGKTELLINVKIKATESEAVTINAGYYSVREIESTGNIGRVDSKTIERQPVNNVLQALQGRVPGVVVTQRTGVAGGIMTIQIRGQNSLRFDANYPLYVIDGVPVESRPTQSYSRILSNGLDPLSSINPADIASIEILKDADATAIYGSRGANGVVLITTKKGKAGKTNLDINIYRGTGKVTSRVDLLNTQQYLEMRREAFKNINRNPGAADYDLNGTWDQNRYTDWQDLMFGGTAEMTDAQLALSGGNATTSFRAGGSFHHETTVFPGDFNYRKATGSFNINHISPNQKFRIILSANYNVDKNKLFNASVVSNAFRLAPNAPIYRDNGELDWRGYDNSDVKNPFSDLLLSFTTDVRRFITNGLLSYELFRGFSIKTSLGYTDMRTKEVINTPLAAIDPASLNESTSQRADNNAQSWIIEPQLTYSTKLGAGKLEALVGVTWQQNVNTVLRVRGTGFLTDELLGNLSAARLVSISDDEATMYKYNAVFGRIGYNWKDRYVINLTGRRDGSSRFGPDKQFANFGAIGAAWIFSSEEFMQRSLPFLSFGKLRASYGTTGSDQIGDYGYLSTFSADNGYDYQGRSLLLTDVLGNPDYAWEINKKLEVSMATGFFNDRLYISASWYRNRSSNQLVGYPLPTITGFSSVQANFDATVQNTGWEFELAAPNILPGRNGLRLSAAMNITFPNNKLVAYPNLEGSSYANTYVIGQSLFIRKSYHFLGLDSATGLYKVEDLDKNGIYGSEDRQSIVDVRRQYYGGFNIGFGYKGWELNWFTEFVKQTGRNYISSFANAPGTLNNQPVVVLGRWQKPGDNTTIQKFTTSATTYSRMTSSDINQANASFVRIKNVSLAYNLPASFINKLKMKECKLYVMGQNLFTFTSYKGLDPENPPGNVVPAMRVITAGIQLKF